MSNLPRKTILYFEGNYGGANGGAMDSLEGKPQLTVHGLTNVSKMNQVRMDRANDKRDIKAGRKDAAAILRNPPDYWLSAKVYDLLTCVPRVGRTKALRWLQMEQVSESRRISRMTLRERVALARHVETWSQRRDDLRRRILA